MKKTKLILSLIALVLIIMVFVQACKKDKQVQVPETYNVSIGEKILIPVNGNTVTLTVASFNGIVCPINAFCIDNYATGIFTFLDKSREQTIELCIGNCDERSKPKKRDIKLNGIRYTAQLNKITPYPNDTKIMNATIVLTKK